jgi:hypothetical protein
MSAISVSGGSDAKSQGGSSSSAGVILACLASISGAIVGSVGTLALITLLR